ncbi:hypothetical protein HQQ80_00390 [Microbacteriaceae bacterium VKM Ac-2855]|nr:hypothetical protein [Microbacteriaceae bacterium VKM Ac-2855]
MNRSSIHNTRTAPTLTSVNPRLWRVSAPTGAVLGHIERTEQAGTERFAARRLRAGMPSGQSLGEFWSVDDAVECFRVA